MNQAARHTKAGRIAFPPAQLRRAAVWPIFIFKSHFARGINSDSAVPEQFLLRQQIKNVTTAT
jgi:hypothetical protein